MLTGTCRLALALLFGVGLTASPAWAAPARVPIQEAIQALEMDHDQALAAAYELEAGGLSAAKALREAWPTMSLLAQARAIDPLIQLAAKHTPALQTLVEAARSEDARIQTLGLAALERVDPRGREGLVALLGDPRVGDRAAQALARSSPTFAIGPLLAAVSTGGGPDRPELRQALALATERSQEAAPKLTAWLQSGPPSPALASVALGLSATDDQRSIVARLIEVALGEPSDFATDWRLLRSAGRAAPSASIDRWLGDQLREAPEWMLREAAMEALALRGHGAQARGSLGDPYPRVRVRAAQILAGDEESWLARAKLARRDPWPMVRAAAVQSLRGEAQALPVIVAAVDDSMSVVRTAAIEALREQPESDGWERVHRRLGDSSEWPSVTAAAIDYAVAHCRFDAVGSLVRVVLRAAPGSARTDEINNAARAIEALRMLRTPEAQSAVESLRNAGGVPPTLKMALDRPLPEDVGCSSARP